MNVVMLKEKTAVIDKRTSQTWPTGWSGRIDAEIVAKWVEGVDYEVKSSTGDAKALTDAQTRVLASAANQALAVQISNEIGDRKLADILKDEIKVLAKAADIEGHDSMKKDDLVDALEAFLAANLSPVQ